MSFSPFVSFFVLISSVLNNKQQKTLVHRVVSIDSTRCPQCPIIKHKVFILLQLHIDNVMDVDLHLLRIFHLKDARLVQASVQEIEGLCHCPQCQLGPNPSEIRPIASTSTVNGVPFGPFTFCFCFGPRSSSSKL